MDIHIDAVFPPQTTVGTIGHYSSRGDGWRYVYIILVLYLKTTRFGDSNPEHKRCRIG